MFSYLLLLGALCWGAATAKMPVYKEWSAKGYVEDSSQKYLGEISASVWHYYPVGFIDDPSFSFFSANSSFFPNAKFSGTSWGNTTMFVSTQDYDNAVVNTDCEIDDYVLRTYFNFNGQNSWLVNATADYDPTTKHTLYTLPCNQTIPCYSLLTSSSYGVTQIASSASYLWALNASAGGLPKSVAVLDSVSRQPQWRFVFEQFSTDPTKLYEGPAQKEEQPAKACVTLDEDKLCYNGTIQTEVRVFTRTHDWSIWGWLLNDVNVADVSGEATWVSCSFSQYFTQFQVTVGNNWSRYLYCGQSQCSETSWEDYTTLGHKEALGASARVDQCYLNHTDGEWWDIPTNGRCPPQHSVGDIRACGWEFDYQILKTVNGSCLQQIATSMGCSSHNDSIAVLTQGFQQCPDVGHFLVGEHVRALRTADERRDAVTPIQFPAEHKHYGRIFYKTPMMGVFYAPEEHRIVDVNQYFKSLI